MTCLFSCLFKSEWARFSSTRWARGAVERSFWSCRSRSFDLALNDDSISWLCRLLRVCGIPGTYSTLLRDSPGFSGILLLILLLLLIVLISSDFFWFLLTSSDFFFFVVAKILDWGPYRLSLAFFNWQFCLFCYWNSWRNIDRIYFFFSFSFWLWNWISHLSRWPGLFVCRVDNSWLMMLIFDVCGIAGIAETSLRVAEEEEWDSCRILLRLWLLELLPDYFCFLLL